MNVFLLEQARPSSCNPNTWIKAAVARNLQGAVSPVFASS